MASHVEPLVLGRVIGDVVDMFVPALSMSVHYGNKHVNTGCEIKPSMALHPPRVQISGSPTDLFALVMVDPDAPSPSEPLLREWVHWVVADIPGGTNPSRGQELIPYMAPRPLIGIHRFVFLLFKQKAPFPPATPPATRAYFKTRDFADRYELGLPVAVVFYNSQKERTIRRRH